uniref:molybdopterin-dependent oxidoreductase n=1 Tax=Vibrio anguillarum TaxID=55601 RepID=UPI004047AFD1
MMRWITALPLIFFSLFVHAASLTITLPNQDRVTYSLAQFAEILPRETFTTQLPWLPKENTFTGFKVIDLINHLQVGQVSSVSFLAINDYAANIAIENLTRYEPIIAYHMNGDEMKIRNKGPFWLIYNLDKYPQIDNGIYYTQMVWQLEKLLIHGK